MAFSLLRTEPEETIIQSLGCHGKAGKISMADNGLVWGFDDFYLLPKQEIPGSPVSCPSCERWYRGSSVGY